MVENKQYQILSLLKTKFPGFESKLERMYRQDAVFRQIASEYHECIKKQEVEIGTKGNIYDFYADTIKELNEEVLVHLNETIKNAQ